MSSKKKIIKKTAVANTAVHDLPPFRSQQPQFSFSDIMYSPEVSAVIKEYEQKEIVHQQEVYSLKKQITEIEKSSYEMNNILRGEVMKGNEQYRALEAKLNEVRQNSKSLIDAALKPVIEENEQLKKELEKKKKEIEYKSQKLNSMKAFIEKESQLSQDLQHAKEREAELEKKLLDAQQNAVVAVAETRTAVEARIATAVSKAVEDAKKDFEKKSLEELILLREQNAKLLKSIEQLKVLGCANVSQSSTHTYDSNGRSSNYINQGNTIISQAPITISKRNISRLGMNSNTLNVADLADDQAQHQIYQSANQESSLDSVVMQRSQHSLINNANASLKEEVKNLTKRLGEIRRQLDEKNNEIDALKAKQELELEKSAQFIVKLNETHMNALNKLRTELGSMEKLVYTKCKELFKLRALTKVILQKRTTLEAFLTKALDVELQNMITASSSSKVQGIKDESISVSGDSKPPICMSHGVRHALLENDIGCGSRTSISSVNYDYSMLSMDSSIISKPAIAIAENKKEDIPENYTDVDGNRVKLPGTMDMMLKSLQTPIKNKIIKEELLDIPPMIFVNTVRKWISILNYGTGGH